MEIDGWKILFIHLHMLMRKYEENSKLGSTTSQIHKMCLVPHRVSLIAHTGYANEVGEAFRHMVPLRCVHLSYAISSGYVISHAIAQGITMRRNKLKTASKTAHVHQIGSDINNYSLTSHNNFSSSSPATELNNHSLVSTKSLPPTAAVLDTLLWQGLASVAIPGLLINRLCAGSRLLLNRYAVRVLSQQARRWAVTGVGLASIPMIIHPIDW